MRIAFVSPKWNTMVNSYPPLGLGYLAAVAQQEGHDAALFDLGLEPKTPLAVDIERILSFSPDVIAVTAMTNNYHSAEQMIVLLREQSDAPIIIGGPHTTIFPGRVIANPDIDFAIFGEGEYTLLELLRVLVAEQLEPNAANLRAIKGLCFRDGDEIVCNEPRELIEDLDALPFPARELYELDRYPLYAPNGERMVTVLTSRGCPFNCSYCFKGIMGNAYRQRSPESILAEIHSLMDTYGYRDFYFIDDLFTFDRRLLRAVCTRIIEEGLDIRWQCLARVDTVTPELLELMHRSGCRELHYGIESGNPDILDRLGKGISMDRVRKAISWTAQAGIEVKGYFMLGLPGDTDETMEQTIAFASELELDQAMFSLTTPFPGTRLWTELVSRQPEIEFNSDWSKAFYYNNYDEAIKPFMNVSDVSDARLSELAHEAQSRFQEAKRKRKYTKALGSFVGGGLYAISRMGWARALGRRLLRKTPLGSAAGLKQLGHYDDREEHQKKWK